MITDTQLMVEHVDCAWGFVPVQCHFSYGRIDQFPFVLVRIRSGEFCGWGESLHPINDAFLQILEQLPGTSLSQLMSCNAAYDDALRKLYEAINIAAYDLLGHAQQKPLCELLGDPKRSAIPLMPTLFPTSPTMAAKQAAHFAAQNIRSFKVKLQGHLDHDLATIRALREAAPQIKHCVGDVNQGYSLAEIRASDALAKMKAAGLTIIEDPCKAEPEQLATLRSPDHPRIMLDTPVRTRECLNAVLAAGAADIVNLHPCHQETFAEAITRAALCEAQNIPAWVGATGFLGVGSAAYQHLASVIGLSGPCGELAGNHDHGMPTLVNTAVEIKNGFAHLPNTPGHGATPMIDDRLAPYIKDRVGFM